MVGESLVLRSRRGGITRLGRKSAGRPAFLRQVAQERSSPARVDHADHLSLKTPPGSSGLPTEHGRYIGFKRISDVADVLVAGVQVGVKTGFVVQGRGQLDAIGLQMFCDDGEQARTQTTETPAVIGVGKTDPQLPALRRRARASPGYRPLSTGRIRRPDAPRGTSDSRHPPGRPPD